MKTIFSLITMSIFCSTFAQEFSFPIYFEDALGNKDTIVIGYDATATNGIDPQFGEVDILNQPWQGPLDVRVGNTFYSGYTGVTIPLTPGTILTKKAFQPLYCPIENVLQNHYSIEFFAENLPLKMKFDGSLLNSDTCTINTTISGHDYASISLLKIAHFSNDSLKIDYIQNENIFSHIDTFEIKDFISNVGYSALHSYTINSKKIGVMNFDFFHKNTLAKQELSYEPFNIFPNPTTDNFYIETEAEITHLEIFDALGKSVLQQTGNNKTVQIEHLEVGMYTLKIDTHIGTLNFKINKL